MTSRPKYRKPRLTGRQSAQARTPHWDVGCNELYFGGRRVHHFSHLAAEQVALLAALQAHGWPRFIDRDLAPELRTFTKQRLRDTVHNLNRSVGCHLHFFQEGNGARIGWRPGRRKSR